MSDSETADDGTPCPPHCCCCGPGEPCCDCGEIMPDPTTSAGIAAALVDLDVELPLRVCDAHLGSVVDANGGEIFVVDVNNEWPDEQTRAVARMLVLAVNTAGGFKAERADG